MITLVNIKDWIKTLDTGAEHFYTGKLENKKNKSIGIYQLNNSKPPNIALGGLKNTSYIRKSVSILIHWTNDSEETEKAGISLYQKLLNIKDVEINGIKVFYINLLVDEPKDVGTDNNNIYERVIQVEFFYERND